MNKARVRVTNRSVEKKNILINEGWHKEKAVTIKA